MPSYGLLFLYIFLHQIQINYYFLQLLFSIPPFSIYKILSVFLIFTSLLILSYKSGYCSKLYWTYNFLYEYLSSIHASQSSFTIYRLLLTLISINTLRTATFTKVDENITWWWCLADISWWWCLFISWFIFIVFICLVNSSFPIYTHIYI